VGGRAAAILAVSVAALTAAPAGLAAPIQQPIKTKPPPVNEENGASTGTGYLTWSQTTRAHPNRTNEYFQRSGGRPVRVNPAGTQGFGGGVDGTTLVYQQVRGGRSDLRLYSLTARKNHLPPPGVNTFRWEWHPTISGNWLLYGRIASGIQQAVLFNLSTHKLRLLDHVTSPGVVEPGQVSGGFATWDRCDPRCNVFRYRISTGTTLRVPNPLVRYQYAPSVDSAGNVFYDRGGHRCGRAVHLMELPAGGSPRSLLALHPTVDAGFSYAVEGGSSERLLFSKFHCSTQNWDIFRIAVP
jgi:hypothetical protein